MMLCSGTIVNGMHGKAAVFTVLVFMIYVSGFMIYGFNIIDLWYRVYGSTMYCLCINA